VRAVLVLMNTNSHPPCDARRLRNTTIALGLATLVVALASTVVLAGTVGVAGALVSGRYDASVDATVADIQAYWAQSLPQVYGTKYDAIPTDRLYPYSADNLPPNCDDGGQTRVPYDQVKGNAFYCSNGDFVAYDTQELIPKLRSQYGEFAVGLVFAHEWGHAIQARVGYQPRATVYLEQQADCFAGAWAQHVATSADPNVHLAKTDLDTALAGLLALRDPSGIDGSQDGAHGNGFDRVSAFQDGYEGGAQACADYQNNPPTVTEAAYTSQSDYANGGNLSMDELLPTMTDSLKSYWTGATTKFTGATKLVAADSTHASCNDSDKGVLDDAVTYCPSTDAVTYDATKLQQEHDSVGDFASGVLLATEYSSAVQHALGRTVDAASARKVSECLAGAWAADIGGGSANGTSSLSPGDLDEAITALVSSRSGAVDRGTAFDRVSAFRKGFHNGPSTCLKSA
jgi:predicted metalloprotease